jgi:hypothetical protein
MEMSTAAPSRRFLAGGFAGALILSIATLAMIPMALRGMLSSWALFAAHLLLPL